MIGMKKFYKEVESGKIEKLKINPDTKLIEPTQNFKKEIERYFETKSEAKNIPYIRQEGTFEVKLIKKQNLETKDGIILTFETNTGEVYKAGIFFDGFSQSDDDIEDVIDLLQSGQQMVIRISKNFRNTKYYVRYLKFILDGTTYEAGNKEEPL